MEAYSAEFSSITVSEAREALRGTEGFTEKTLAFIDGAIKAKRIDVLAMGYNEQVALTEYYLLKRLFEMPDCELKIDLVLIVLKSPITNALMEDNPGGSNEGARVYFTESMMPIIRKTLPDVPVEYNQISSLEKRIKLAASMEKALGREPEHPEEARHVWPPRLTTRALNSNEVGGATENSPYSPIAVVTKPAVSTPLPSEWTLWAGITAVTAAAAGWFLLRRNGSGGKS